MTLNIQEICLVYHKTYFSFPWVFGMHVHSLAQDRAHVQLLICVQLFVTPWTVAPTGSSVRRIFQARILEWVAISSFRGSSRPRDQAGISCISCIDRRILYHCASWEVVEVQESIKKFITDYQSIILIRQFLWAIVDNWNYFRM